MTIAGEQTSGKTSALGSIFLKQSTWTAFALFLAVSFAGELLETPDKAFEVQNHEALVRTARLNQDLDRVQSILGRANRAIVRQIVNSNEYSPLQLDVARDDLHRALADAKDVSLSGQANAPQFDEIQVQADTWFAASRGVLERSQRASTHLRLEDEDEVAASTQLDTLEGLITDLRLAEDTLLDASTRSVEPPSKVLPLAIEAASFFLLCLLYLVFARRYQLRLSTLGRDKAGLEPFLKFVENLPLPLLVLNPTDFQILFANRAAEQKYGYAREELVRKTLSDLRDPSQRDRAREWWATSPFHTGEAVDGGVWTHRRKNGSHFDAWAHLERTQLEGRTVALLVVTDVTEHQSREQALIKSKTVLEGVLDSLPVNVAWKDQHCVYIGANKGFIENAGVADKSQIVGRISPMVDENALLARCAANDAKVLAGLIELRNVEEVHPNNGDAWISRSQLPLFDTTGKIVGVVDAYEDITVHKRSELAMRLRLRALDASVNAILITRRTAKGNLIEYTNPAFERMTGYTTEETLGRSCGFLHGADEDQPGVSQVAHAMASGTEVSAVIRNYRKDGTRFWNKLYIAPIRELGGNPTHYVGVLTDVTELMNYQEQLEHQANFDNLTLLPNRSLLHARLVRGISEGHMNGTSMAVLFLDLDLFKNVNDSLGHDVGDRLLQSISERLVGCVRDTDTVARYGGDEFVMVLPHPERLELRALLSRILTAVSEPVFVDEHELYVEASIGVSRFPSDGDTPEALLKKADAAMYLAKERGRNNYQFYNGELDAEVNERLALSNRLRKAVRAGELIVHYQPQVDMSTGQIIGAEALLRWTDPELGAISPATFIPLAEETGLIVKMGEFVLTRACEQLREWEAQGLPPIRMSVNVSPQQILRSNVLAMVKSVLAQTGAPGTQLELEMTESTLMSNAQEAAVLLDNLRALGIQVAIDDFGTGYSSLSYLKKFSIDRIKIDRTFVRDIGEDGDDELITRAVIALAKTLDVKVIAEGVETAKQRDFLLEHGCLEAQGFLYSPAVAPDNFARQVKDRAAVRMPQPAEEV